MATVPSTGQIVFVPFMAVLLAGALGVLTLYDPSLWIPKRWGVGWTINFANPHAWLVPAIHIVWLGLLLFGLSHPDAPGISTLLHLLGRL